MFKWLNTLLTSKPHTSHRPPPTRRTLLGMEELHSRDLPSSHVFGGGFGMLDVNHARAGTTAFSTSLRSNSSSSRSYEASGSHGSCGAGADATFTATLANADGATGTASYDAAKNSLTISIKDATASTSLDVQLDGVSIGTLTTDASGNGTLKIKDLTAAVNATSALTVGDLTGNFTQVMFSATLTGSDSAISATAVYCSTRQDLNVSLKGLTAKTTYSLLIDGTSVGSVTTNKNGIARFHLNSSSLTIVAGSMLTIVDASNNTLLTGIFA